MQITWNLVTKNLHPHEQLQSKIRQKISKLEQHLQHFAADAVHLQIVLERHLRKGWFKAALTLRIPSNILHSAKTADDPIPAFDLAVKALIRELAGHKAGLRKQHLWLRKKRQPEIGSEKVVRFSPEPMPAGTGPQEFGEMVHGLLGEHYQRLVAYVGRQLLRAEGNGDLPKAAIDPEVVVDEIASHALANPASKPPEISYRTWFYGLASQELKARLGRMARQLSERVSLEQPRRLTEQEEIADGYGPEQPLEVLERRLGPPFVEIGAFIVDAQVVSPDEALAHKDFVEYLRLAAHQWPEDEQHVFELYYLENIEPEEVAVLEKISPREVSALLDSVQSRLRDLMGEAVEQHAGAGLAQKAV